MALTYKHTKYAAYIGYVTQAIVNNLAPLLFVSFQREFSLSLDRISVLITTNFGVQIITDLIAARCVDRIGYRFACLIAHILAAAGLVGYGVLPFVISPYAGLLICSAVCAIGGGLTEVVISPVVEALPGDEKESAMSLLHSFYCWGQVLVVLLSTIYFSLFGAGEWRFLPFIWAIIPLFNVFFFCKVPIRHLNENGESVPVKKLFCKKAFWLFIILMICAGASELAMSQWASLFAEEGIGVSKTFGDLLGPCAFAALMGISRTVYGIFGAKMNLRYFILGSGILCVISYFTAVFASVPVLSLIGCAFCGLSVGIMWPGTYSLAARRFEQGGTALFAVLALAGDVGCTAGPALAGFVGDASANLKTGLLAAVIFPAVMVIGTAFLRINTDK